MVWQFFCSSPHAHRFSPSLCSTFRVPRKVWFWLRSSSCTSAGLRWVTAWRPAMAIKFGLNSCPAWKQIVHIPVVPHKAVAEVSKIGRYRRGELLWCILTSGATNHWKKHSVSRLSYLFAHLPFLSSDSFSSDLLSSNLSLLSASSLLCFSSVHIVGSLTSKLPSTSMFIVG